MPLHYETRYAASPKAVKQYDTEELRDEFLIRDVFTPGQIRLTYTHYDRYVAGGAAPIEEPLSLDPIDPLKADFFLARRELGIINVGGSGSVTVDGETYAIGCKEALYVGRGSRDVSFASDDADAPAKFYLNSAPAHAAHPVQKVTETDAELVTTGAPETSNHRTIRKLLVGSVIDTCQLQMGMTELKSGSVWNTIPAHTHDRRMEVYFYFEVAEGQSVCHFMGQPQETRHVWMQNEEAAISPPWSIHAGAGTGSYTFIWGMAGENLDYGDMDAVATDELR